VAFIVTQSESMFESDVVDTFRKKMEANQVSG
jgi:hypothetical protein